MPVACVRLLRRLTDHKFVELDTICRDLEKRGFGEERRGLVKEALVSCTLSFPPWTNVELVSLQL